MLAVGYNVTSVEVFASVHVTANQPKFTAAAANARRNNETKEMKKVIVLDLVLLGSTSTTEADAEQPYRE